MGSLRRLLEPRVRLDGRAILRSVIVVALVVSSLMALPADDEGVADEPKRQAYQPFDTNSMRRIGAEGKLVAWATECGDFIEYVPEVLAENLRIIVLVHGSIHENESAFDTADSYIKKRAWHGFADDTGCIIVAPAFDRERFGGYRHLDGSPVRADEFVIRLALTYKQVYGLSDARFYLYGHSAGAQFAHRFLVTHPEKVLGVVMSAPGNYANPEPDIAWGYGMVNAPNPNGFLHSARTLATVVVGAEDLDTETMGGRHQFGNSRVARAHYWVDSMRALADRNGVESLLELVVVADLGHTSSSLLAFSLTELRAIMTLQGQFAPAAR